MSTETENRSKSAIELKPKLAVDHVWEQRNWKQSGPLDDLPFYA
jgi:hypothetical protein